MTLMLNKMRGVSWIYLAEDRDRRCALFEHSNELRVPQNVKSFETDRLTEEEVCRRCLLFEIFRLQLGLL